MFEARIPQAAAELQQKIRRLERLEPVRNTRLVSSGCAGLDRLLSTGGLRRGSLVEWLMTERSSGAGMLAMIAASGACEQGGALVVIDQGDRFYPPSAAALGVDLKRTIVVQPRNQRDGQWALDQSLRCPAVAAVWAMIDKLDSRSFRRLQLAAETSGCLGLLLRPANVQGQPAWSDVQLLVRPSPMQKRSDPICQNSPQGSARKLDLTPFPAWRWRVQVVRCRGGTGGGAVDLEIDETTGMLREVNTNETPALHLAAQLARPATRRRAARA